MSSFGAFIGVSDLGICLPCTNFMSGLSDGASAVSDLVWFRRAFGVLCRNTTGSAIASSSRLPARTENTGNPHPIRCFRMAMLHSSRQKGERGAADNSYSAEPVLAAVSSWIVAL